MENFHPKRNRLSLFFNNITMTQPKIDINMLFKHSKTFCLWLYIKQSLLYSSTTNQGHPTKFSANLMNKNHEG